MEINLEKRGGGVVEKEIILQKKTVYPQNLW